MCCSPPEAVRTERPWPTGTSGRKSPISLLASPRGLVSPRPRLPERLLPQHLSWFVLTSPGGRLGVSRIAHVWYTPSVTSFAVVPLPRLTYGSMSPISPGLSPRCERSPTPRFAPPL